MNTKDAMPNAEFAAIMTAVYVPLLVLMLWALGGKRLRRWWRRRKLNITDKGENLRTISGPLWDISWIKVSEATEKYPEAQDSTVLGHDLPEAIQVLKAKYGDEFDEKNVRRATKQSYTNVIVGIPEPSK
jgi:hypothetical protein